MSKHRHCKTCAGKDFVYCEQLAGVRRCMQCNPPIASFAIAFEPDPSEDREGMQWAFAEAMAGAFCEVAAVMDAEEMKRQP